MKPINAMHDAGEQKDQIVIANVAEKITEQITCKINKKG